VGEGVCLGARSISSGHDGTTRALPRASTARVRKNHCTTFQRRCRTSQSSKASSRTPVSCGLIVSQARATPADRSRPASSRRQDRAARKSTRTAVCPSRTQATEKRDKEASRTGTQRGTAGTAGRRR
jgi:hypothetical protein